VASGVSVGPDFAAAFRFRVAFAFFAASLRFVAAMLAFLVAAAFTADALRFFAAAFAFLVAAALFAVAVRFRVAAAFFAAALRSVAFFMARSIAERQGQACVHTIGKASPVVSLLRSRPAHNPDTMLAPE